MFRCPRSWEHHKFARPSGFCRDPFLPGQFRERRLLANVVDASGCLFGGCGQRYPVGDIIDIPAGGTPGSDIVSHQYGRSPIGETLKQREESVEGVSWPVYHREPQNRARNARLIHDAFLDSDFVVVIIEPGKDVLHRLQCRCGV